MGDDNGGFSGFIGKPKATDPRFTKSYTSKDVRKKKRKEQRKARKKNR